MKHKIESASLMVALVIFFGILAFFIKETNAQGKSQTFAGIEMIQLPGGKVPSFWMGRYEVTQKQYEEIMSKNPSYFKGKPDNPVEKISWYDAIVFCNKLSIKAGFKPYYIIDKKKKDPDNKCKYDAFKWSVTIYPGANGFRLPTSAEWEYACRAGTTSTYYWGEDKDFNLIDQYEVYIKNSYKKGKDHVDYGTNRVGSKKPNPWGLYDMGGNVFEWCFDWYPDGSGNYRIIRGGNWQENTNVLESGYVWYHYPVIMNNVTGFRLARSL